MATVVLRFSAVPELVRTARIVTGAVARVLEFAEPVIDEMRFAVGEASARAVQRLAAQVTGPSAAAPRSTARWVQIELSDDEHEVCIVVTYGPAAGGDPSGGDPSGGRRPGGRRPGEGATAGAGEPGDAPGVPADTPAADDTRAAELSLALVRSLADESTVSVLVDADGHRVEAVRMIWRRDRAAADA